MAWTFGNMGSLSLGNLEMSEASNQKNKKQSQIRKTKTKKPTQTRNQKLRNKEPTTPLNIPTPTTAPHHPNGLFWFLSVI